MRIDLLLAVVALAFLLVLRSLERRSTSGRIRTLMTDRKDPVAARQQLRGLFAEDAAKETAHRTKLWEEAHSSPRAGRELRRLLEEDLKAKEDVRHILAGNPDSAEGVKQLDGDRRGIRQQLEQLDALMRELRS